MDITIKVTIFAFQNTKKKMNGLLIGLLLPFLGTALGAACVFLMKRQMPDLLQKTLLGFASGVMVAASVWSLLIPAMEMGGAETEAVRVVPAVCGFLCGIAFLLLMDRVIPHLHLGSSSPEGPRSRLSRTSMLALAVTLHNLPEGMAVGVALAAALEQSSYLPTTCWRSPPAPWSTWWWRNSSPRPRRAAIPTSAPSVSPPGSR